MIYSSLRASFGIFYPPENKMDYKEALDYMESVGFFGSKPGLERIERLCSALGEPQEKLRYIHIAGTNGKGSCAAMLASILKAAGYRTGLYTSPYLFRFNERMQINGEQIPDEALADIVSRIKPLADAMEDDHPTEFELMTAAAFLWFAEEKCDIVVLETGLGGRFDATNIIKAPEVSVIMNIGLDHTGVLGDTVEKIAFEKAGIIKKGRPCVCYGQTEGVTRVIKEQCAFIGSELTVSDFSALEQIFDSLDGQAFAYKGKSYALPLLGEHQMKNAAVVIDCVEKMRELGWDISPDALERGLYAVSWPARFEVVSDEPYFVVDGGHNPQCAQTVRDNLLRYFADKRRVLLIGVLADKDYEGLARILDEAADMYVCVSPESERALSAAELAEKLAAFGKEVLYFDSIEEGVEAAKEAASDDGMVCAVGSLYMAGPVRAMFGLF